MTDITLLDGSIGQELVRRAPARATPLWSTQVMIDFPDLVRDVHDAYFAVGATVATTNTYAVLRDRLDGAGMADELARLTDYAVTAACAARDDNGAGRVAGAIGPLMATYRPDLCPPAAEAAELYREAVDGLKDRVDLLAFETLSSVEQVDGALRAVQGVDVPVWIAVSVDDFDGTLLRSGEPLADLAPLIAQHRPAAVLINCSRPEAVTAGLTVLAGFGCPFGAYANGFTQISDGFLEARPTIDALEARTDLGPDAYADFAMSWVAQGASIVGGCCEVGPDHIAELARRLRAAGHDIV